MLTNIMPYWITGAIGSSFRPYYVRMHGPWPIPDGARIGVPMRYAEFPKEILRPPRSSSRNCWLRKSASSSGGCAGLRVCTIAFGLPARACFHASRPMLRRNFRFISVA